MLSAEFLDGLSREILELYAGLNESIARDIARRLVKTGTLTSTAKLQALRVQESGMLYKEVLAQVARYSGALQGSVQVLFEQAGLEAYLQDASIYKAAGLSAPPVPMSPSAMQILQAGARKTSRQLSNLTKTTALEAQQAFIRGATLAEMQIESGAFDAATAIRSGVREALKDGATVQYPTGHRDKVDVAVRRAVLTGVNQTCAAISLHSAQSMGCDLVEVTAHPGARPEHMAWQGKIFSISGKHPKYPKLKTATGYGTGAGLCGWNCRHSFYPYFEGLSERAYPREKLAEYETRTVPYKDKDVPLYQATQRQRASERQIRAARRELIGIEAATKEGSASVKQALQADFTAAAVKLKKQEATLKDFLKQTGLRADTTRVQVQGFGRSVSQRAVWADRKFTNAPARGIMTPSDKMGVKLDVNYICRINRELYSVVTTDITTAEVIITARQIQHIKERHSDISGDVQKYLSEILLHPDYIMETEKPNTANILKQLDVNGTAYQLVLRLKTSSDPVMFKNSIITLMVVNEKRWKQYLRNRKILYKKE